MARRVAEVARGALIGRRGGMAAGLVAVVLAAGTGTVLLRSSAVLEGDDEPMTVGANGPVTIPAGQVTDGIYLARGEVVVEGTVEHDVIVGSGAARVAGEVGGDVVVLDGTADVVRGGVVQGDLRTSDPATVAPRGEVVGAVGSAGVADLPGLLPGRLWWGLWAMAGAVALLAGLALRNVAPAGWRAATATGRARPGRSALLGAVTLVGGGVLAGLLSLSLIGLLAAGVLAAVLLVLAAGGGAVAGAAAGQAVLPGRPVPALVAGWAAGGGAVGLGLLVTPLLGALVAGAVATYGIGALVGAWWDERRASEPVQRPSRDDPDGHRPGVDDEPLAGPGPRVLASLPILADHDGRRPAGVP